MFAILKKLAHNWRTEITRWSSRRHQWPVARRGFDRFQTLSKLITPLIERPPRRLNLLPARRRRVRGEGGEVQRAPRAGEASVSNHFHRASPTLQRGNSFLESGLLPLVVSVNWNTSPRVVALTLQHVESPLSVWRIPVELVDCKVSSYLLDTTRFCITYTA